MLALSAAAVPIVGLFMLICDGCSRASRSCPDIFALNTDNGRDSLLPPKTDDGANAFTEAFVSKLFRLLLFVEDANVRTLASSVSRLFAVAIEYVCGWLPWRFEATRGGIALAAVGVVGN